MIANSNTLANLIEAVRELRKNSESADMLCFTLPLEPAILRHLKAMGYDCSKIERSPIDKIASILP